MLHHLTTDKAFSLSLSGNIPTIKETIVPYITYECPYCLNRWSTDQIIISCCDCGEDVIVLEDAELVLS